MPKLAGPTRAAAAGPEARDVFPGTRTEIFQPEREIADLLRQLGEAGNWLQVAQQAFEAEREARLATMAEADAAREARLTAEAQAQKARIAAEAEARDARRWRDQAQAHAAARLQADTTLSELLQSRTRRQETLEEERRVLLADVEAERARREAEAETRRAELDRQAALIDAVRRSRAWRVGRRVWHVSRRVRSTGAQIAAPHSAPGSRADLAIPELAPDQGAADGPEELSPPCRRCPGWRRSTASGGWWARSRTGCSRQGSAGSRASRCSTPRITCAVMPTSRRPGSTQTRTLSNPARWRAGAAWIPRISPGSTSSLALFDHAIRALPPEAEDDSDLPDLLADVNHIGIFVSSHGNVFMEDLADDLASDLRSVGVRVDVLDETSDIETRPPTCLFVAPHEFFTLGRGSDWVRTDVLSEGFMFGTEQLQTNWFNLSLPFILMSRGMLDICPQTASLFKRLAMATLHVLPGARHRPHSLTERDRDHPLYGVLPPAARSDIDPSLPFAADRSTSASSVRPARGATRSSPATPPSSLTTRRSTTTGAPVAGRSGARGRMGL